VARTYILKEPQYVREDVATSVALLRYLRFFSNGEEISPVTAEAAARYDRILEQMKDGVPLSQIVELQEIGKEIEQAEERRRIFRNYKERLREVSLRLARQDRLPTRAEVTTLLQIIEGSPLLASVPAQPELGCMIETFKKHPYLAREEYISCRYIRHLIATNFADEFYLSGFFESLQIRYTDSAAEFRFYDGYAWDFPKLLPIAGSIFCFTGKFRFGARQKCREAVVSNGGTWIQSPTGSTDFLVVAHNGENTSPRSTKVTACMDLKSRGFPCFLLEEEFWLAHLKRDSMRIESMISAAEEMP
jgi:NAD-dependent DNA ligase